MHPAMLPAFEHAGVIVAGGFDSPPDFVSYDLAIQGPRIAQKFARFEFRKDFAALLVFKHDPDTVQALRARLSQVLQPARERPDLWSTLTIADDPGALRECLAHAYGFAFGKLTKVQRGDIEAIRGEPNRYPGFTALGQSLATVDGAVRYSVQDVPSILCEGRRIATFDLNRLFLMTSDWSRQEPGFDRPDDWAAVVETAIAAHRQSSAIESARLSALVASKPAVPRRDLVGQVNIRHVTLTGETIRCDGDAPYGQVISDAELVDCDLASSCRQRMFMLARTRMTGGTLRQRVEMKNFAYDTAHFERVAFSGRFTGCDFGSRDLVDGSVTACDFSNARLHYCRVATADLAANRFAPWPTFVVPRGLLGHVDPADVPDALRIFVGVIAREDALEFPYTASVDDAELLAKKEHIELDTLRRFLARVGVKT